MRTVSFRLPFDFLNVQRNQLREMSPPRLQQEGAPFRDGDVSRDAQRITDILFDSSLGVGLPVNVTAVVASLEQCDRTQRELDVVFHAFTSRIPFFPARTAESADIERADPVRGAGLDRQLRFSLIPSFDYDRAAGAQGGASMGVRDLGLIETLDLEGSASSKSRFVEGAFNGSWSPGRQWLRRADWRTSYLYSEQPSASGRLKKHVGAGQVSALIRDFGATGPMLRVGATYEQGALGSRFLASELPAGTVSGAPYAGIKLFSGLSWRGQSQTVSLSYGLQLGSVGGGFSNGFRKHVSDAIYQARLLPRDHMPHEIDIRFSAGAIQNLGGVPVTERFFGGNVPTDFIAGDVWRLNASPVIRSFAQNELRSAGGHQAGGDRFVSFNVSYAPVVWKRPLLPPDLVSTPEFNEKIRGTLDTAETTLRQAYFGRDPAIARIASMTVEHAGLEQAIRGVLMVLQAAEAQPKGGLEDRYFECLDEIQAILDNDDVPKMSDPGVSNAGVAINAMLRQGGRLERLRTCAADLRTLLVPAIDPALAALDTPESALRAVFAGFQPQKAADRAAADLEFTRRVLYRFFHEINLASIAPVALFDAARIGPALNGDQPFRYGVGGGVRLALASTARLTVAYALNPNPRPPERRGAWVISFDIVDVFY